MEGDCVFSGFMGTPNSSERLKKVFKANEQSFVLALPTKKKSSSRWETPGIFNLTFRIHCNDVEKLSNNCQEEEAPLGKAISK